MFFDPSRKRDLFCLTGFLVLVFCLQVSTQLNAQVAGQTPSGRITSGSGAGITNARVTFRNPANGETKSISVTEDGSFMLTNLSPGIPEITVSAPGSAESRTNVTINAGADSRADIVMHALGSTEASEGGAWGVSGVVSSKSVKELPLNGRSASDLATLEPGVASARTQSTGQAISGGRPRQDDARLDGISVNDYVNGPPGSALGVSLGSDGVEQFSVPTSNYPAQFGRSSGGIPLPGLKRRESVLTAIPSPLGGNLGALGSVRVQLAITCENPCERRCYRI